ncbi:MAG TPA: DUF1189 family protein [Defluviitaleaceae bacterium]|nr:DUF1189 family protein [Defluviitaleaceae bacterium]
MNNTKIGFFTKLTRTIFDFNIYPHVIGESTGRAVAFLLLFSLLLGIIGSLITSARYLLSGGLTVITDLMPDFEYDSGILTVEDMEEPFIYEMDSNKIFVIDMNDEVDADILEYYSEGIMLKQDRVIAVQYGNIQEVSYTEFLDSYNIYHFSKEDLSKILPVIDIGIVVIMIGFGVIGSVIGKMISSLFVSVLGLIVNAVTEAKLTYSDIYKTGVYALILPSLIKLILSSAGRNVGFIRMIFFVVYYGIVIFYLVKAVTTIKRNKQEMMYQQYQQNMMQ